jgi:hypothetical protein
VLETDRDQASLEKAHGSLVGYRISEFFGLNRTTREQAKKRQKKLWILKLRARETAEKVKSCQGATMTRLHQKKLIDSVHATLGRIVFPVWWHSFI